MLEIKCDGTNVYDIGRGECVRPDADFHCFPRCPGITFPDTPETFSSPGTTGKYIYPPMCLIMILIWSIFWT